MKRFLLISILCAALLFAGCRAKEEAVFVDPNAVTGGGYGALYFESDDVRFGIFDEASAVMEQLPEHNGTFVGESCAFDGFDTYYFYHGFELMVNDIQGTERITNIRIIDDTISTPQGLFIGMAESELNTLLPEAESQSGVYTLRDGTCVLSVAVKDGTVTDISYAPAE